MTRHPIAPEFPGAQCDPAGQSWTVERLQVWIGGMVVLVVTLAGSLPCIALAVYGDGLVWVYVGLAGIIVSGVAGLALAYRFPPADLDLARLSSGRRR